jgi:molybdate transport system substrate-binding protein
MMQAQAQAGRIRVLLVSKAGSIALEIQFVQTFSAAVVAGSGHIEGSKRLIEFLASARASETIRNSGMEPLATSR